LVDQGSRWQAIVEVTVEWLTDLTGYTARGHVKASRTLGGAPVLFEFDAYMSVDVLNHQVLIDIPADVSAAWVWTKGVYDLELFDGDPAHDVRFLQGDIKVDKEVTVQ
jgi:hypothetical protein